MSETTFPFEPVSLFSAIADAFSRKDLDSGAAVLDGGYPFEAIEKQGRRYTAVQCMRLYLHDGFVDRYSGAPLVNPGVLRLFSWWLPERFPFHPHWKMSETHPAYYEFFPTVDHVVPVARGGADTMDNWVTTSMLRNGAKGNFTLGQLDWTLHPRGDLGKWDGLSSWMLGQWQMDPEWASLPERGRSTHQPYVNRWCRATANMWKDRV